MYEDNEKRINWLNVLKRIIVIIIILVIIFGIITLVTKCSKKEEIKKPEEPTVNLKSQISDIQKATIEYLTVETLPLTINQTKTVKLKYLINKDLITNLKDSNGNTCDTDESYSEITRLANNYAMKTVVVCGKNIDYSVVYIGCFDSCKDGICIGNESNSGICTTSKEEENKNNNNTNNNNNNTNNTTKTTTKTTKTTKTTTKAKVLYEYKKANYSYTCPEGELINNNCKVTDVWTYTGKVKETTVPTVTYNTVPAKVEQVTFTNPSSAYNTANAKYELVTFKNGKYVYNKYSCTSGTLNGTTCTTSTTTYNTTRSCENSAYTYNANNNTCTKQSVVTLWKDAEEIITYDYTWSTETSLAGWTRTGRTK